jgi:hypothetical protein
MIVTMSYSKFIASGVKIPISHAAIIEMRRVLLGQTPLVSAEASALRSYLLEVLKTKERENLLPPE